MADERERGGDGVGGAGGLRLGPRVEDVDDVVGGEAEGGAGGEDNRGACVGMGAAVRRRSAHAERGTARHGGAPMRMPPRTTKGTVITSIAKIESAVTTAVPGGKKRKRATRMPTVPTATAYIPATLLYSSSSYL